MISFIEVIYLQSDQLDGFAAFVFYFSLSWIFLSFVTIKWIHPALTIVYLNIKPYWFFLYPVVLLYLFIDFLFSIHKHSKQVVLLEN